MCHPEEARRADEGSHPTGPARYSIPMHQYHVYILATRGRVLYVGVTNDLRRRVLEHKAHLAPGFTQRYNVDRLVYFETTANVQAALAREKVLKGWRREKKVTLIEAENPEWRDLAGEWAEG